MGEGLALGKGLGLQLDVHKGAGKKSMTGEADRKMACLPGLRAGHVAVVAD